MDLEDRALLQMVLQVAADARAGCAPGRCRARASQSAGPTPETLQDLRRADGTGRQRMISPLSPRLEEPAVLPHEPDAGGALAVLEDRAGLDEDVRSRGGDSARFEHRLQEGAGGGPAEAALLVDVEVADPGRCRRC